MTMARLVEWDAIEIRISGEKMNEIARSIRIPPVETDEYVSHVSLNDGTVEGLAGDDFASVQFHPEAAPGPLDALPFFDRVAEACRGARIFARS